MGRATGAQARIFWNNETTPGTYRGVSSTSGLRLYAAPIDGVLDPGYRLIGPIGASSAVALDPPVGFAIFGERLVRARLRHRMRYSGISALLVGWATGKLTTNPFSGGAYHKVETGSSLTSASITHQLPISSSALSESRIVGLQPSRLRLGHEAGGLMTLDLEMLGTDIQYTTTETTSVPPDNGVASPGEMLIESWHADHIRAGIGAAVYDLVTTTWEVELDNGLEAIYRAGSVKTPVAIVRTGTRSVIFRAEIEQDASWEALRGAMDAETETGIAMEYWPQYTTDYNCVIEVSNCKVVSCPRATARLGGQKAVVEMVAHYKAGSTNINPETLVLDMMNLTEGPYAGVAYGDLC